MNRRSTPKVKDGKVQKKNRHTLSPDYYELEPRELVIDRQRPGEGARHLLTVKDIRTFIGMIPDWPKLSHGLRAIALTPFDEYFFGRYNEVGIIKISAWPADLWIDLHPNIAERERPLLNRLNVSSEVSQIGLLCKFTEDQAKAAQLLGTFLHELGHHVDRMTTKSQRECSRGEEFAERFEREMGEQIWDDYTRVFRI